MVEPEVLVEALMVLVIAALAVLLGLGLLVLLGRVERKDLPARKDLPETPVPLEPQARGKETVDPVRPVILEPGTIRGKGTEKADRKGKSK